MHWNWLCHWRCCIGNWSTKGRHNHIRCSRDKGPRLSHKACSLCRLVLHFVIFLQCHYQIKKQNTRIKHANILRVLLVDLNTWSPIWVKLIIRIRIWTKSLDSIMMESIPCIFTSLHLIVYVYFFSVHTRLWQNREEKKDLSNPKIALKTENFEEKTDNFS